MSIHDGVLPSTLCDAIVTALRTYLLAPTGLVKTIDRLDDDDPEAIGLALSGGAPAIFVLWHGNTTDHGITTAQKWDDSVSIRLLCVSGYARSRAGRRERETVGASVIPGVEELLYASRYLALRALWTAGAKRLDPGAMIPAEKMAPGAYIGAVDLKVGQRWEIYDDEPEAIIAKLGLVANPIDPDDLWTDDDDLDPNIEDPATKQGGVVTL